MLETGQLRPVVNRRYPLSEVPTAVRALAAGHSRGKSVITMDAGQSLEVVAQLVAGGAA